jgi:uncharacterized protein
VTLPKPRALPMPEIISQLHPDPFTEPFWAAAREHRLVAARCASCGTVRPMPPGPFCWNCPGDGIDWLTLPGLGTVYSFTVVRSAPLPELEELVPFAIAVIELDGAPGARLISNIVGTGIDQVSVGLRVQVTWDHVNDETVIPRFTPVSLPLRQDAYSVGS